MAVRSRGDLPSADDFRNALRHGARRLSCQGRKPSDAGLLPRHTGDDGAMAGRLGLKRSNAAWSTFGGHNDSGSPADSLRDTR